MRVRRIVALLAAVVMPALAVGVGAGAASAATRPIEIVVLSNRPDLVSGGDVRIALAPRSGLALSSVKVALNGKDVTSRFRTVNDQSFRTPYTRQAYVTGLRQGANVFTATAKGFSGRLTVTNHGDGPAFSGPRFTHYRCPVETPTCAAKPTFTYLYKSKNPLKVGLQPYDPKKPPSDVATTVSDTGAVAPFVVRREDGWNDRDRYTILTLFRPDSPAAIADQPQFNHKLLMTHGGGCGASYGPGDPPLADFSGTIPTELPGISPTYVTALGKGFSVLSTALDNTGHNCNVAKNAESLMQAKEHFVEQYGSIRYTIGTGCSGGSIAQHTVANAYPGIYQGLTTTCSYPDTMSAGAQFADYHLLRLYFEDPTRWAPGVAWLPTQMAHVEGHLTHLNAVVADEGLFKSALNPEHACDGTVDPVAGDPSTRYDSEINPKGVRCSVLDLLINVLGPRPSSVWTPQEKAAGRGFAGIPFANNGVIYGLEAFRSGGITAAQLVDLNTKIGGLDVDSQPTTTRIAGDQTAIERLYRSGMINEANHLDQVAMINYGGPDPGLAHDYAHAFWTEDRLMKAQGHTDNRVMWFGVTPLIGDPRWANESFLAMDRWLASVEKDTSTKLLADKIVDDKPADITDRCSNVPGLLQKPGADDEVDCVLPDVLQTRLSTPREMAGGDRLNDNVACQLKPLTRGDVDQGLFRVSDSQLAALQKIFPKGVCDYSKPGRGQGPAETWLTYFNSSGGVQHGGRALPSFGARHGAGLQSASFASTLRQ